jgi:hypothetical protein
MATQKSLRIKQGIEKIPSTAAPVLLQAISSYTSSILFFIQGANLPLLLRTTISPFALISLFFGTLHRFYHVRFHGVFHASVNAFEIFITVPP